uniref:Uncharacterized protein n=1 Tax=Oxera neriifolia associated virus TaxID=2933183 RepID=A0A9C7LLL4_9VIRU|nr:hypothetical protein 1 [Oxera neriifolia associated virus]
MFTLLSSGPDPPQISNIPQNSHFSINLNTTEPSGWLTLLVRELIVRDRSLLTESLENLRRENPSQTVVLLDVLGKSSSNNSKFRGPYLWSPVFKTFYGSIQFVDLNMPISTSVNNMFETFMEKHGLTESTIKALPDPYSEVQPSVTLHAVETSSTQPSYFTVDPNALDPITPIANPSHYTPTSKIRFLRQLPWVDLSHIRLWLTQAQTVDFHVKEIRRSLVIRMSQLFHFQSPFDQYHRFPINGWFVDLASEAFTKVLNQILGCLNCKYTSSISEETISLYYELLTQLNEILLRETADSVFDRFTFEKTFELTWTDGTDRRSQNQHHVRPINYGKSTPIAQVDFVEKLSNLPL